MNKLYLLIIPIVVLLLVYAFVAIKQYYYSEMSEILPNLYLGNIWNATSSKQLENQDITHIYSIIDQEVPIVHKDISSLDNKSEIPVRTFEIIPIIYKKITIKDIPAANISTYFQESANYIDKVLKTGESNILIHCKAGVSRSASIVIAYLMIKRGLRLSQALQLVQLCRPIVNPNSGFMRQLKELDIQLLKY